ncbi:hypothetical protein DLR11_25015 [Salmonella enterica subsp. salamae]|nr:hypothetical protein [Salmonella enterica subsp. enterica serovar Enteritidis]EAN5459956.1 hypothetical protein [Salmonella enterica]ECI3454998.1 hypothetical protein [Salmonella enterica subsp. salamae]ECU6713054.1 hypothetical protein [Salmonella enterica subsp. enterica serovar Typhimurium]MKD68365.1 hypothetical protein [Salmonella enterica subsp. enterica]
MLTRFGDGVMVISLQQNLQPGISTPITQSAHNTRQRVFLCVVPAHTRIMVAQVGPTSVGPVAD